MEFKGSAARSVGLEMEFQLLDSHNLDLTDGILPLLQAARDKPYIKAEMNQATVEVNSRICPDVHTLAENFTTFVRDLWRHCEELGMQLCGGGTHPFCNRLAHITPLPRYREQEKRAGYLARIMVTFGMHVHVGMTNGNEAVRVMRRLKPYLPLLLAVSANSPYWHGLDSGYASYRSRVLAAMRSYGLPPDFTSWEEFEHVYYAARRAGTFASPRDVHWDIRLQPDLGTLEVRIMDAQSTLREAVQLTALVYVLAEHLKRREASGEVSGLLTPRHWCVQKENLFRASRYGLAAELIVDDAGSTVPARALLAQTLEAVAPTAEALDAAHLLADLEGRDGGDVRQRRLYRQTGSLKRLVAQMAAALAAELEA